MNLFTAQTGHHHLRRLTALRTFAVLAQCTAIVLAVAVLDLKLPMVPLFSVVAVLAAVNVLTWLRLRSARPVSNAELFSQLCVDVLALAVLAYFSGGSTNPFISLFLLPLVIAAATLPRVYTWSMAALTTFLYTLLMWLYVPLRQTGPGGATLSMDMNHAPAGMSGLQHESIFSLHIFGMWLGFVLSAGIISWFVVKMAEAVRERDAALAAAREETLRNERIVALGTLAAGAAHELGTPLSTMAVVVGELADEDELSPEWRESFALLDGQLRSCRRILDRMLEDGGTAAQPLAPFISGTIEEWRLLRPATVCEYRAAEFGHAELAVFDTALRPALLNLLNNAADASPEKIAVEVCCDTRELVLTIIDHGPGLTAEAVARAGSAFFTTKQEGRGLGLFLANATLERMGGRVRLFNRAGGGATTEVTLPLKGVAR